MEVKDTTKAPLSMTTGPALPETADSHRLWIPMRPKTAELPAHGQRPKEQLVAIERYVKFAYTIGHTKSRIKEPVHDFAVTLYQVMYARPPMGRVSHPSLYAERVKKVA